MVAMLASRVALSCEPMKRSTLSSSISRTADFAVSAGGPPASVKIRRTGRPRMPPALLIRSAARSAQARCVGPNSDAGPLSAMKNPILNSFACANAGRNTPAPSAAARAAVADEGGKRRHPLAVQGHRLVVADRCGGKRRRRKDDRRDIVAREVVAERCLQLRTQHVEGVPIARLRNRAFAVQALQQTGDVGARALRGQLAVAH